DDVLYLSHVFQRLSNADKYLMTELNNKLSIADDLFEKFGKDITELLAKIYDVEALAKWAGALSALQSFEGVAPRPGEAEGRAHFQVGNLVAVLCARVLKASPEE